MSEILRLKMIELDMMMIGFKRDDIDKMSAEDVQIYRHLYAHIVRTQRENAG